MRTFLLTIILLATHAFAQDSELSLSNVREGKSYYSKSSHARLVKVVLKEISRQEIISIYQHALKKQDAKKLCSYTLNEAIKEELNARSLKVSFEGLIYVLRQENEIDDVVASILIRAHEVKTTGLIEKEEDDLILPTENEKTKSQLQLVASFENRFAKNSCYDDAYRSYYAELLKTDKHIKSYQVEALNRKALIDGRISEELYTTLEQARLNELESPKLTLASYQQKIRTLRIQYPLRDEKERSDFVSAAVKKIKVSRRQKLFENYSDLQIILMGNVVKKLRNRLEYDAVEITGYRDGVAQETLILDPMERFRFAIKALRKEMSLLALNTYFGGKSPDYIDLMVASYEIGIIPASELEAVASLEEIWNPKKTFWDKANVWIRTLSSVATIVIPPPYGFIPALALVVIEATVVKKKDTNAIDPTSMF